MKPTFKVTKDLTDDFMKSLRTLKSDHVLVGIPEEKTNRANSDTVNNATILAINNFGSPANNIPARPVMQNGIVNAQSEIADQFAQAAEEVLSGGSARAYYDRAGIIASTSIKKAINAQDFEGGGPNNSGPSDATLAARKADGFKGTKSLIVTGQMRNAITYVVKDGNG